MSDKFLLWRDSLIAFLGAIGLDPADSADTRIKKRIHVFFTFGFIAAGLSWGLIYFAIGERLAGIISAAYAVVSSLSLFVFYRTKNYPIFRFSQLFYILLLPFLLMVALGGFINASAVIVWSLLCPLAALVLSSPRAAMLWFLSFVGLVNISSFLQPLARQQQPFAYADHPLFCP